MYLGYVTIKKSEKNSFFNVLKLLKITVEEPFEDPITQPLADVDVVAEPGSKRQHVAYEEHHYSWESTITPTLTQPRTQAEVLKSDGEEITIIESPESSPKQFLSPKRFLSPSGFFVPGMYTCMHCKQSFKTLNHRDLHMKVCSTNASVLEPNELPVQCPVCKKFFNNISYVKQHVLIAHNISIWCKTNHHEEFNKRYWKMTLAYCGWRLGRWKLMRLLSLCRRKQKFD